MAKQEPTKTIKLIRGIPVFGSVFAIANGYAFKGDYRSTVEVASLSQWWNRVFRKVWYTLVFVSFLVLTAPKKICELQWVPADTILGAFPSILGFGIGVYALMFIMPNDFLSFLRTRTSMKPEIVPVDMGYPLIAYVIVMFIAAVNKFYPESYHFKLISIWALFYGLAMTVELIAFLFISSRTIQHIRSQKTESYLRRRKNRQE